MGSAYQGQSAHLPSSEWQLQLLEPDLQLCDGQLLRPHVRDGLRRAVAVEDLRRQAESLLITAVLQLLQHPDTACTTWVRPSGKARSEVPEQAISVNLDGAPRRPTLLSLAADSALLRLVSRMVPFCRGWHTSQA